MKYIVSLLTALSMLQPVAVHAATFMEGDSVELTEQAQDDLYAAGEMIRIDQRINGDLFVVGADISLSETVTGDIAAAGGSIYFDGSAEDDMRVAGGDVTINGTIDGDLIVFGGNVIIQKEAFIAGDLITAGGNVRLLGGVGGDVWARTGNLLLDGVVNGNIDVEGGVITVSGAIGGTSVIAVEDLKIAGSNAAFNGDVRYWQKDGEVDFGDTVKSGTVTYDESLRTIGKHDAAKAGALVGVFAIGLFLSAVLFMALMILATKTYFKDAADKVEDQPLWMLLWGFLFLVATPVVGVLFCLTMIGIPIGLFIFVMYGFTLLFSCALTSLVFGKWTQNHFKLRKGKPMHLLLSVVSYVIFMLLSVVPFIGWLAQAAWVCTGLGALMMTKMEKYKKVM